MFALARPTPLVATMAPRRGVVTSRAPKRTFRVPVRAVAADHGDESGVISGTFLVSYLALVCRATV